MSTPDNTKPSEDKKETADEILKRLEKTYNDRVLKLNKCKDAYLTAYQETFTALQEFASFKEGFLVSFIQSQNEKLKKHEEPDPEPKSTSEPEPKVEPKTEQRENNLS